MKRYKFLREGMKSHHGSFKWELGRWYKHEGNLEMNWSGFHCSRRIYDSFWYVQGELLAEVEVRGDSIIGMDKEVWSEMRVVRTWEWTKKDSVALGIYVANLVLPIFEKECPNDKRPMKAIRAARRWLRNPTEEIGGAAWEDWSAAVGAAEYARSAAARSDAARFVVSAAVSAAYAAGSSVAKSAAYARSAAKSAFYACGETMEKIYKWMERRKYRLKPVGECKLIME